MFTEDDNRCMRPKSSVAFANFLDGLGKTSLAGEIHEPILDGSAELSIYSGGLATAAASRRDRAIARGRIDPREDQFGSCHVGVCNFTFSDGSVRSFGVELGVDIVSALASRAGRELPVSLE
jgi:hypothetical protein